MQQTARLADDAAFFLMDVLIETGPAEQIFTNPHDRRTEDSITGRVSWPGRTTTIGQP
ncbi:hypothetical protein [Kallotenue papyrolyticum]|uniref:hypothetical protein n=1 Tax=Kallotenue papyrolyticum TaxID=1325125 RepID=UPI0004B3A7DB|nr:hypothetical protein [Kallotenue papyrolyticum]